MSDDPFMGARSQGHSWDDIDQYVGTTSQAAMDEGYSDDEIRDYLGYSSPQPFEDHAQTSWSQSLAGDPDLQQAMLIDATMPDLTRNPGWRSTYANAIDQNHVTGPQDFADRYAAAAINAAGGVNLDQDTRQRLTASAGDAADAMVPALPSPRDFTDAALSFDATDYDPSTVRKNLIDHWQATGQDPVQAAMAARSNDDLRTQLTTPKGGPGFWDQFGSGVRDIIGGGVRFTAHLLDAVPGLVDGIHAAKSAITDLTGVALPQLGTDGIDAIEKARLKGLREQGYDGWGRTFGQMAATLPLFSTLGFEGLAGAVAAGATGGIAAGAFSPSEAEDYWSGQAKAMVENGVVGAAGGAALHGAFTAIGKMISKMTPEGAAALRDAVPDVLNPKVDVLNPGADNPVTQIAAADAHAIVEPAPMVERAVAEGAEPKPAQISPEASAAAKIARITDMEFNRNIGEDEFSNPSLFRDLYEKSVTEGMMAADPATEALADGHDVARGFRGFLTDMLTGAMKDEGGAMTLPPVRTPAQAVEAAARRQNRDYFRALGNKFSGQRNQQMAYWTKRLQPLAVALDPHMDEFTGEIAKGPAGNVGNTVIGKWLSYIEGRSQGVTFDKSHPLYPWADTVREFNQAMDQRLRQQAHEGVINYDGYIQDYFVHMFKDPAAMLQKLGVGSGKLGSRGNLMQRTGPPSVVDALSHGIELRDSNPFNMILQDMHNKLAYSYSADMVDQAIKDGMMRWDNAALPGDVAVGTSFGRKLYAQVPGELTMADHRAVQQYAANAGTTYDKAKADLIQMGQINPRTAKELQEGARPGEMRLMANPELVKNFDYWRQQINYSDTTASNLDRLLYMKNTLTGIKLVAPFFHAITVGIGSIAGSIGQGLEELGRGQFADAMKDLLLAPIAVGRDYRASVAAHSAYVGLGNDRVINLLRDQNFNFRGQNPLERYGGRTPSVFDSIMSGRSLGDWMQAPDAGMLPRQLRDSAASILGDAKTEAEGYRILRTPDRAVQFAIREAGRTMSLVNGPFFEHAIPSIKLGQAYRRLDSFLRANPTATDEAINKYARQITQDVDNRLGELQLDNVYWPKMAKVLANIATISTSWVYGSYRGFLAAVGWNLEARAFEWNPVATSSLIGTLSTFAIANGLMTYLHTGTAPDSWRDWLNFRTGGIGTGLAKGGPERAMIPSELKELFDIGTIIAKSWQEPTHAAGATTDYVMGKLNPFWQGIRGAVTGQDGIGHNIAEMPGGWKRFALDQLSPIALSQVATRSKTTGLSSLENVAGFREAPKWAEAWDSYQGWQKFNEAKITKAELSRARKEVAQMQTTPWWGQNLPPAKGRQPSAAKLDHQRFDVMGMKAANPRAQRFLQTIQNYRQNRASPYYDPELEKRTGTTLTDRLRRARGVNPNYDPRRGF
jgi:hypothetical protein